MADVVTGLPDDQTIRLAIHVARVQGSVAVAEVIEALRDRLLAAEAEVRRLGRSPVRTWPMWRCNHKRDHAICGTFNACDSETCAACGADRPHDTAKGA